MVKIGVIADDITGSNDIGLMYSKNKLKAYIYDINDEIIDSNCDVLIINTSSRGYSKELSKQVVQQAVEKLEEFNVDVIFNKTCSVFRGNIGTEFDVTYENKKETMHVVLGFPDMGRTTIHGIHYLNGVKIEDSQFKNDPINPIKESDLVKIIESESKYKAISFSYENYDKDINAVAKEIEKLEKNYEFIIYDVRNNNDLSYLGKLLRNKKHLGGASAIANYLSKNENEPGNLVVVGSLTEETARQVSTFSKYAIIVEPKISELLNLDIKNTAKEISKLMDKGYNVLFSTIKEKNNNQIENLNRKIQEIVSELVSEIYKISKFNKLIVAGGETSNSISKKMNFVGQEIVDEVEVGIAMCKVLNYNDMKVIFKSGSFGGNDFFNKAINKLKN